MIASKSEVAPSGLPKLSIVRSSNPTSLRERLRQVAFSLYGINRRFVRRSHDLTEEVSGCLLLKIAREIQTAAIVEEHCHSHTALRAGQIANRFQLTINAQLKIFQPEPGDCNALRVDH